MPPAALPAVRLEPKTTTTAALSVRLPVALAEAVRGYSERREVTISSVVAVALSEYLAHAKRDKLDGAR